jgi:hypothetical protein
MPNHQHSVKIAADVIEDVATVQCREAQACINMYCLCSSYISRFSNVATGNYLDSRARILAGPRLRAIANLQRHSRKDVQL